MTPIDPHFFLHKIVVIYKGDLLQKEIFKKNYFCAFERQFSLLTKMLKIAKIELFFDLSGTKILV